MFVKASYHNDMKNKLVHFIDNFFKKLPNHGDFVFLK